MAAPAFPGRFRFASSTALDYPRVLVVLLPAPGLRSDSVAMTLPVRTLGWSLLVALLPALAAAAPKTAAEPTGEAPPAARETTHADGDGGQKKKKKKKKDDKKKKKDGDKTAKDAKPVVEVHGRVHAGWELEHLNEAPGDDVAQTTNSFLIRRARVKVIGEPTKWLRGVVNVDAAELFELGGSVLRDAYADVRALRQLRFRLGQFKRPFSGLELRSSARLKVIERGDGNEFIVEDLRYGDRDLGLKVFGRLIKDLRLDYDVGVFNGSGPNLTDPGVSKDFVGRLEICPFEALRLGASGAYKVFDDVVEGQPENGWAAGGDFRLRLRGIRLFGEAMVGVDHAVWRNHPGDPAYESPLAFDVVAILSRRFELPVEWRFALEPAFKFEFLDPNGEIVDDHLMSFTPGLNSYFGENFRVIVNGEFRHASRNTPDEFPGRKVLRMMGCLDF